MVNIVIFSIITDSIDFTFPYNANNKYAKKLMSTAKRTTD